MGYTCIKVSRRSSPEPQASGPNLRSRSETFVVSADTANLARGSRDLCASGN